MTGKAWKRGYTVALGRLPRSSRPVAVGAHADRPNHVVAPHAAGGEGDGLLHGRPGRVMARTIAEAADPNVAAVQRKLAERAARGLAKYGVDTTRQDIDLRGWLQHLQDELLDAAVYVERLMGEANGR